MNVLALPARVTATLAFGLFLALLSAQHWDNVREHHPIEFADLDGLWLGALRIVHHSGPLYDDPESIKAGIATVVYPPPIVEALIPLTPLGYSTGGLLFMLIQLACLGVTLWAIRVVDWRCWVLAAFSVPTIEQPRLGQSGDARHHRLGSPVALARRRSAPRARVYVCRNRKAHAASGRFLDGSHETAVSRPTVHLGSSGCAPGRVGGDRL
jgi:hypothetical protein